VIDFLIAQEHLMQIWILLKGKKGKGEKKNKQKEQGSVFLSAGKKTQTLLFLRAA